MARPIREGDVVSFGGRQWVVVEVYDDRERMLLIEREGARDYQPRRNVRVVGEQEPLFGDDGP